MIDLLWAAMIVACVAATQLAQGSYHNDLATHADEAGHFVTALCLLDYARTALGSNPVSFAESYYAHYPKVAFGHWPPAFFGIQAFWYWIFGASVSAGMLLIGVIAASAALVLFLRLRGFYGTKLAVLALAVYLSMPLVWTSSSVLMSDMLTSLFEILAVLTFCDGVVERSWRPWVASAFWGGMAVLTKASAVSLLLCAPPAFVLLSGGPLMRPRMMRYFLPAFCLLALPLLAIYHITFRDVRGLPLTLARHVRGLLPSHLPLAVVGGRVQSLSSIPRLVSWPVLVIAGLGILFAVRSNVERSIYLRGSALWLTVCLVIQVIVRDSMEDRYFLPVVFPIIILFGEGLAGVSTRVAAWVKTLPVQRQWSTVIFPSLIPLTVTMVCVASIPTAVVRHRSGYDRVVASVPPADAQTILVSSDPSGEGALIVDFLVQDPEKRLIVLRGSKMLASSDWMGGGHRLLLTTVAEVRNLLDAIPVHFIVLDANGFLDEGTRPHHRLLEQTMRSGSDRFRFIADVPLVLDRRPSHGMIQVYENLNARGRAPEVIRIPMETSLRRTIEVNVHDSNAAGARSISTSRLGSTIGLSLRSLAVRLPFLNPFQGYRISDFHIRPTRDTIGAEGGPGEISVMAETGREWDVRATSPWITITSKRHGPGDGVLRYDVAQNDSNQMRSGTIVIGPARYVVSQAALQ